MNITVFKPKLYQAMLSGGLSHVDFTFPTFFSYLFRKITVRRQRRAEFVINPEELFHVDIYWSWVSLFDLKTIFKFVLTRCL